MDVVFSVCIVKKIYTTLCYIVLHTKNSDKIERVQRPAARFVKSRYSRYSSVSDMLDVLG